MEIIRVFCNSMDIRPKALLSHFLRYLGFYTEEIEGETEPSQINSVADIYIVSDYYMEGRAELDVDIESEYKTIMAFTDGWSTESRNVSHFHFDDCTSNGQFLFDLITRLASIVRTQSIYEDLLVGRERDLEAKLRHLVNAYEASDILQSAIYSRCFYRQPQLFTVALQHYTKFIKAIEMMTNTVQGGDLVEFAKTYAQYEVNSICRMNSREYCYPVNEMVKTCLALLERHPQNEQLRILLADMYLDFEESWAKAANEYGDIHLIHCAYANLKRGSILRKYKRDYRSALDVLGWAVQRNGKYYKAWYQIGMCLEETGKYAEAVDAFEEVCRILDRKYQKHLLAPLELEYLYKAVLNIIQIQRIWIGDDVSADMYEQILRGLLEEAQNTEYLKKVWESVYQYKNMAAIIGSTLQGELLAANEKVVHTAKIQL